MTADDMVRRTKTFSLRIVKLSAALPRTREADVLGRQLLRSGTSVGANYRAARRGRSAAEFRAKLGIVEEEADECLYWIELLIESGLIPDAEARLRPLHREAEEILSIVVASIRTSKRNGGTPVRGGRRPR